MNYSGPYRHKLILAGKPGSRRIVSKLKDGKQVNFVSPLTKSKRPKIYVIKIEGEIVYIGYTSQSITTRLNYGLKAKGKNGYHGYKWKKDHDEVELLVFVFEKSYVGDKEEDLKTKHFVEAIEAELVYKYRNANDRWPKYQHEIHFNNFKRKNVQGIAGYIWKYINE